MLHEVYCNAQMPSRIVREVCRPPVRRCAAQNGYGTVQLSARAYDRILKVARTAADLGGSADIRIEDLAEAIHYRWIERGGQGDLYFDIRYSVFDIRHF